MTKLRRSGCQKTHFIYFLFVSVGFSYRSQEVTDDLIFEKVVSFRIKGHDRLYFCVYEQIDLKNNQDLPWIRKTIQGKEYVKSLPVWTFDDRR